MSVDRLRSLPRDACGWILQVPISACRSMPLLQCRGPFRRGLLRPVPRGGLSHAGPAGPKFETGSLTVHADFAPALPGRGAARHGQPGWASLWHRRLDDCRRSCRTVEVAACAPAARRRKKADRQGRPTGERETCKMAARAWLSESDTIEHAGWEITNVAPPAPQRGRALSGRTGREPEVRASD